MSEAESGADDKAVTPPATASAAPAAPGTPVAQARAKLRMPHLGVNLRGHVRQLAAFVLALLAIFLAWQGALLRAQQTASTSIANAVRDSAPKLLAPLVAARQQFAAAVALPAVVGGASGDADALAAARRALHAALGEAEDVDLYPPDPGILTGQATAALGYVRAAQLARAQSDGSSSLDVVRGPVGSQVLSLVAPVHAGSTTVAYAAANLPIKPMRKIFDDLPLPRGRFDVRRGNGGDAPVVMSRGVGHDAGIEARAALDSTGLWITAAAPVARAVLPGTLSPWLTWFLAALAVAGAAALSWGAGALVLIERLRWGRGQGAEPTLADVVGGGSTPAPATAKSNVAADGARLVVDRSIFRAYDIRGVMGKTLDGDVARLLGQAIGSAALERNQNDIVVGRDGRLSGPELVAGLIAGLRATGVNVIDIGRVPTPVVYFACFHLNTGSGIAVTGSHNPPDYNGFKVVLGGETLAEDAIQDLYARIAEGRFATGSGSLREQDIGADYIERIASDVQVERPLNVVVDCGNGVTGELGPQLLQAIGCKVTPLYAEIDGNFPNHHPDPSEPKNLQDLVLAVKHQNADLGIAFDGDGDRLGVVTHSGEIVFPDRVLMLFAMDVLVRDPGATIIYDVKCTGHLQAVILRHGGSPLMWKTGHSLIKAKMRETNAALAGEMSGHFFFRERWYGFDDGLYSAARLLEILAGDLDGRTPDEIFASLPKGVATPELHIQMQEGENHSFVERFRKQAHFEDARITTIDGLRADWPDGWGLVRASNTTPVLVLRFDADSSAALERIENEFRTQLLALEPTLKLPF